MCQAQKGRIPVRPRAPRRREGEPVDFKVVPLRMEAATVANLDDAWHRFGVKSRTELFRRTRCTSTSPNTDEGEATAALYAPEARPHGRRLRASPLGRVTPGPRCPSPLAGYRIDVDRHDAESLRDLDSEQRAAVRRTRILPRSPP